MQIEIYQSDAFTAKKQDLLARISSDYRFQKGDEVYIHTSAERWTKVRIIDVRIHVLEDGTLSGEILALKL